MRGKTDTPQQCTADTALNGTADMERFGMNTDVALQAAESRAGQAKGHQHLILIQLQQLTSHSNSADGGPDASGVESVIPGFRSHCLIDFGIDFNANDKRSQDLLSACTH